MIFSYGILMGNAVFGHDGFRFNSGASSLRINEDTPRVKNRPGKAGHHRD